MISPASYPFQPGPPRKPPVVAWDVILTVIFLVLLAGLTLLMSFFGFFLVMASDPCGGRDCSTDLIGIGVIAAVCLPWIVLIVALIVSIVRMVKRRIAFWVPMAASVLVVGSWFLGAAIAAAGVPAL